MGINRRALALLTMAVSGGMAGLAGVLFTYYARRHHAGER